MKRETCNLKQPKDPQQWDISNLQSQMNSFIYSHDSKNYSAAQYIDNQFKQQETERSVDGFFLKSAKQRFTRTRKKKRPDEDNFADNLFKKKKFGLKKVLKQQKIKAIITNFVNKIKTNLTNSSPIEYQPFQREAENGLASTEGINIPNWIDLAISFCSIIQILCLFFVYTLSLVFQELIENDNIKNLQTFSVIFYSLEILLNFSAMRIINGKKLQNLREIGFNYLKKKFPVDMVCLIILIIDIAATFTYTKYFRLCVVLKIGQCFHKMEKIQNFFLTNFYKEQYWALVKVFLVNFAFAHILAVLLIAMSSLSAENSWLHKIQAQDAPWFQKYAWAYYWGTTTMLTVGFGDLTPANYKEAICLTLIETFSCILLAYNINCVGNLISNIRSQDIEKNKNMKIMRRLAQQNNINEDLQFQICNYINESDKMRKKFQFQTDKQFIRGLPEELKGEFLKQANIKIFKNLVFFKNLTQKTLLQLAEQIQVKIAHPEQIVLKSGQFSQFMIIRSGKVGYCAKIPDSDFHHTVIDQIKVTKNGSPSFLHLNFITGNHQEKYDIKSLGYSMISTIQSQKLMTIIKSSACDFQNFCQLRDKSKHIPDEFEVLTCTACSGKHSKMKCPKLHYIPFAQFIVFRYLQSVKKGICERKKVPRYNKKKPNFWKPLKKYSKDYVNYEIMIYGKKMAENKQKTLSRMANNEFKSMQKSISFQLDKKKDDDIRLGDWISCQVSSRSNQCENTKINEVLTAFQEKFLNIMKQNTKSDENQNNILKQIDQLHNFNYYFSKWNPQHLAYISFKKKQNSNTRKQSYNEEMREISRQ